MKIDLNKEEFEFIIRFCKRSIQFASQLGEKSRGIFDPELGENIEKATKLHNKLQRAYEIAWITENENQVKE